MSDILNITTRRKCPIQKPRVIAYTRCGPHVTQGLVLDPAIATTRTVMG